MTNSVEVLLTTYNGMPFLREQLDSLVAQTVPFFTIRVHDDGSSDETKALLQDYKVHFPDRMIIDKSPKIGSAKGNFLYLMSQSDADYIFFCDQDDVWLPEKMEEALSAIKALEAEKGEEMPLLVHSDLQVVDANLQVMDPSFSHYVGLVPLTTLKEALMQNDVTGCTAVYNKALSTLLKDHLPIPEKIIMHDWWVALIAHVFGEKEMLSDAPILYRQHGNNSMGAKKSYGLFYKVKKLFSSKEVKEALNETYVQAGEFLRVFGEILPADTALLLEQFAAMENMGKWARIRQMKKYGFFRKRTKQRIAQILFA